MGIHLDKMMRVARMVSLSDPGMGHDLEMNIRKIAIYSGGSGSYSTLGGPSPGKLRHIYFDKFKEAYKKFQDFAEAELAYLEEVKENFHIYEKGGVLPQELARKIGYDYKKGESLIKPKNNPLGNMLLAEVLEAEKTRLNRTANSVKRLAFLRKKSRHHLALFKGIKDKIKDLFKGKENPLEGEDPSRTPSFDDPSDVKDETFHPSDFKRKKKPGEYEDPMESFQSKINDIIFEENRNVKELTKQEERYKKNYADLTSSPSYERLLTCISFLPLMISSCKRMYKELVEKEKRLAPTKMDSKYIDPRKTTKYGLPQVSVPEVDEESVQTEFFGSPLGEPTSMTQKAKRLVDNPTSNEELQSARELYYSLGEMLKRKNVL